MAKVSFNKLGLDKNNMSQVKNMVYNDQNIEVKQYLPIAEKANLINEVVQKISNVSYSDIKNSIAIEIFFNLAIINYYTNINFTDKQKEDSYKLYDLLESNDLFSKIIENIPAEEYDFLRDSMIETIESVYNFKTSFLGMLESASTDYANVDFDLKRLSENITNPEVLSILKEIAPLVGTNPIN